MKFKRRLLKQLLGTSMRAQSLLLRAQNILYEIEYEKHSSTQARIEIENFFRLLQKVQNVDLVRFGDDLDGGYLLANCVEASSYVFSIGIGDNTSFDHSISKIVSKVIMVDHSVDFFSKNPKLTFFGKKLVPAASLENEITLSELCGTLRAGTPIVLKMDIEGNEWDILKSLDQKLYMRFDQIVVELHGILQKAMCGELQSLIEILQRYLEVFEVVHVHANNYSDFRIFLGYPIVDVIEVTLLRKDLLSQVKANSNLKNLSFPNNPNMPEFFITYPTV